MFCYTAHVKVSFALAVLGVLLALRVLWLAVDIASLNGFYREAQLEQATVVTLGKTSGNEMRVLRLPHDTDSGHIFEVFPKGFDAPDGSNVAVYVNRAARDPVRVPGHDRAWKDIYKKAAVCVAGLIVFLLLYGWNSRRRGTGPQGPATPDAESDAGLNHASA